MTDPALAILADWLDPPAATEWQPHPHQVPPPPPWKYWFLLAGRGAGKTEAGARYVDAYARRNPGHRIAIIAPTLGDARETCVRGESGLIQANPSIRYNVNAGILTWPNGAQARTFGAFTPEDVERLRGPQHHLVWCDEIAAWRYLDDVWKMMEFGLRLGARPHGVLSSTPRPIPRIKALIASPNVIVTRATTDDNPSLHPDVRAALYAEYGGTRLGRQELLAELLEDVPGALWKREWIRYDDPPADLRIVVGVDPAVTSGEDSSLTGIVVAGFSPQQQHAYVLADLSLRATADEWAGVVVRAFHEYGASAVIAEANQGGDLIRSLLANIDPGVPVRLVRATRGKLIRAEPVAIKYEQGRVSHVRPFPELEDQMCSFTHDTEESPDRMDALVWALWDLMVRSGRTEVVKTSIWAGRYERVLPGGGRLVGEKYRDKDRG
jgi:phage terminase large subunit-like protein